MKSSKEKLYELVKERVFYDAQYCGDKNNTCVYCADDDNFCNILGEVIDYNVKSDLSYRHKKCIECFGY